MKCYVEGVEQLDAPFFVFRKKRPHCVTLAGFNLVQNVQAIEIHSVYTPLLHFGKDEVIYYLEIGFGVLQITIIFFPLFPFIRVIRPDKSKLPSQAEMNRLQREYLNAEHEKSRMKSR
jgi:hypothetical protein